MNARKYPRTLEQAFGPYTSRNVEAPATRYDWQDRAILLAGVLAVVGLIAIAVWDL